MVSHGHPLPEPVLAPAPAARLSPAERLAAAREEMSHYDEFDYLIINEDFDTAVDEMCAIFAASRLRREPQIARHGRLITALLADDPKDS